MRLVDPGYRTEITEYCFTRAQIGELEAPAKKLVYEDVLAGDRR